jgi:hypothetical protein
MSRPVISAVRVMPMTGRKRRTDSSVSSGDKPVGPGPVLLRRFGSQPGQYLKQVVIGILRRPDGADGAMALP